MIRFISHERPALTSHSPNQNKPRVSLPAQDPQLLARIDEFHALSQQAPKEMDHQVKLWEAVVSLNYWVAINRGTAQSPRPYMLAGQSGPVLCIFTTPQRAHEAAYTNGLVPANERIMLMAPPLPAALDWALTFSQYGVAGITVDYPRIGAWTPLANLAHLKQTRTQP